MADLMGELVVQHLTGLPVVWKPLDKDGNSQFDAHPEGEGYSLADWQRDKDSGLYSEKDLEGWRAGIFLRIRCTEGEAAAHWGEVEIPAESPIEQVKAILGNTSVKLEEAIAELPLAKPDATFRREIVKAYTVAALDSAAKTYALKGNVVRKEWFATATAIAITPEEAAEKSMGLDTFRSAELTVGTGKTYSTIGGGYAAASGGDYISCWATGSNTYSEALALAKFIYVRGMIANQGLTITYNSGTTVANQSPHTVVENFTIATTSTSGTACSNSTAILYQEPIFRSCVIRNNAGSAGTTIGLQSLATNRNPQAINCLIRDFATGATSTGTRIMCLEHCTVVGCTTGITAGGAGQACPISCLSGGNTTDFANVDATNAIFNVSADATAAGVAAVTGFSVSDWNGDYTLKASVKATTAARIVGMERVREDGSAQIRRRTGYFFAGWHDPDPGIIPTAAQVDPDVTAFGLDNELAGAMDVPALTGVDPLDTLRGAAGTMDVPALSSVLPSDTLRGVPGTSDKLYSAAEEAARNTDPGAAFVVRQADGGPASYLIAGATKTPAFNLLAAEVAYESGRNTVPDLTKVPTPATGGPAAWLQLNVSRVGTQDMDAAKLAFEAARNNDNGTVAGDIIVPATVTIRDVTITGTAVGGALPPDACGLAVSISGTTATALLSSIPALATTVKVYWRLAGEKPWNLGCTITMPTATGTIAGLSKSKLYEFQAVTFNGTQVGYSSNLERKWVTDTSRFKAILDCVEDEIEALAWSGWTASQVTIAWSPALVKDKLLPCAAVAPGNAPDAITAETNTSYSVAYPVRIYLMDRVSTRDTQMESLLSKREALRQRFMQRNVLSEVDGVFNVRVEPMPVVNDPDIDERMLITGVELAVEVEEAR